MQATIALLPGDGIGPEVVDAAERVLNVVAKRFDHNLTLTRWAIGGAALRGGDVPLPESTRAACTSADAVLLGAVGDPEFDHGSLSFTQVCFVLVENKIRFSVSKISVLTKILKYAKT